MTGKQRSEKTNQNQMAQKDAKSRNVFQDALLRQVLDAQISRKIGEVFFES